MTLRCAQLTCILIQLEEGVGDFFHWILFLLWEVMQEGVDDGSLDKVKAGVPGCLLIGVCRFVPFRDVTMNELHKLPPLVKGLSAH